MNSMVVGPKLLSSVKINRNVTAVGVGVRISVVVLSATYGHQVPDVGTPGACANVRNTEAGLFHVEEQSLASHHVDNNQSEK